MPQDVLSPDTYHKSNVLVRAKSSATLFEQKIMALANYNIEINNNSELVAKLYPGQIKKLTTDPSHIYRDLQKLSKKMCGSMMSIEDGKGNFKTYAMVTNADYDNGVFIVTYNKELKKHLLNLQEQGNYTKLYLPQMMSFTNVNAFRLYELFRMDNYRIKNSGGKLDVEYNVSELKFMIGIVDSDSDEHRARMANMGKDIDWDELFDKHEKKKYANWSQFKSRVLDVAKAEMDEKADISFTYEEGLKQRKRVVTVIFHLYENNPVNQISSRIKEEWDAIKDEQDRQLEFPTDIYPELYEEFVGHKDLLIKEDISVFLQTAKMDPDKVRKAIEYVDGKSNVKNYQGYIIKCIQENTWDEHPVIDGSAEVGEVVVEAKKEYDKSDKEAVAKEKWQKLHSNKRWSQFAEWLPADTGETPESLEEAIEQGMYDWQFAVWKWTDFIKLVNKYGEPPKE